MNERLHLFDPTQQPTQVPAPTQTPIPPEDSNLFNMPAMESAPAPALSATDAQGTIPALSPTPAPDSISRMLVPIDPGHGGIVLLQTKKTISVLNRMIFA